MKLTKTQQRFHDLLSDGLPHTKEELRKLLWDEESTKPDYAIAQQLSKLRKQINPQGREIVNRYVGGKIHYMMVRLLASTKE